MRRNQSETLEEALKNPAYIAIGGGVSAQGDNLLNPVKACVADRCYGNLKIADIVMAKLGNDAGIVGAAFLGK